MSRCPCTRSRRQTRVSVRRCLFTASARWLAWLIQPEGEPLPGRRSESRLEMDNVEHGVLLLDVLRFSVRFILLALERLR
jgi:hypothetical protein